MLNDQSQNTLMGMIKNVIEFNNSQHENLFPLASVGIREHRRTYRTGDTVIVKDGKIVNSQGIFTTHEIIELQGTLNDSKHVFTVRDLVTDEILKIEL